MSNTLLVRSLTRDFMQWLDRLIRRQPQIEGYNKTTEFKARGNAWFMIVFYGLLIALWLYVIIAQPYDEDPGPWIKLLYDALMIACIVICILAMRHNISMLKARIVVGPEKLILDGAIDDTKRKRRKRRLDPSMEVSDLVVEIPWKTISRIESDVPMLIVENYGKERFLMDLSLFSTKVTREICKYHKIEEPKQ